MGITRFFTVYYLATPAFALVDVVWGAPIRAVAIGPMSARFAYYAVCFGLGLLVRGKPRLAVPVGIGESTLNLTLLLAGIVTAVYGMADQVLAGAEPFLALPRGWPAGALIYGGVLIAGIQSRIAGLGRRAG
jgi:hypothetical protein